MNSYKITENDFADEMSKKIFRHRFQFYQTSHVKHILNMVAEEYNSFASRVKEINDKVVQAIKEWNAKILIYGSGEHAKKTFRELENRGLHAQIEGFINTYSTGKDAFLLGLPILNVNNLFGSGGKYMVLIPEGIFAEEMYDILIRNGYPDNMILRIPYNFLMRNELPLDSDVEKILHNKESRFIVFGNSWSGLLFRTMIQASGLKANFSIVDYSENPAYSSVRDNLSFVNDLNDVYIVVFDGWKKDNLLEQGVSLDKIVHFCNMDDMQYFDDSIFSPLLLEYLSSKKLVFIDGGSLNLDTAAKFLRWCHGNCKKIVAFELDSNCVELCKQTIAHHSGLHRVVELVERGLWSDEKILSLRESNNRGSSRLVNDAEKQSLAVENIVQVPVTSIDTILQGEPADFIKMDIEGAELEALKGAKETIVKYHPILAISIYHKLEDIVKLPAYIKSLAPFYKLYLRNYHQDLTETVLYALPM